MQIFKLLASFFQLVAIRFSHWTLQYFLERKASVVRYDEEVGDISCLTHVWMSSSAIMMYHHCRRWSRIHCTTIWITMWQESLYIKWVCICA